jgi:hypothetical protein
MAEPRYRSLTQREYEVMALVGVLRSREAAIRNGTGFEYSAWGKNMAARVRVLPDPKRAPKPKPPPAMTAQTWAAMSADARIASGRR